MEQLLPFLISSTQGLLCALIENVRGFAFCFGAGGIKPGKWLKEEQAGGAGELTGSSTIKKGLRSA